MIKECPEPQDEEKVGENAGNTQKYENQTSGSMKIKTQEVPKSNCNKTDINKTDFNDTEHSETDIENPIQSYQSADAGKVRPKTDGMDEMEVYREIIRNNIDYECFLQRDSREREDVDELVELMVETMMLPDNSTVRISGMDKPVAVVKNRFMKLNYSHIEYVLFSLQRNTSKVANIRSYLLTTLYNSSMTMSHYYQAEVNHDLYGGG